MKRRQHVGKKRYRTRVRRKARRAGKVSPRLEPGTSIGHDCYIVDLDGVMWHMQPSIGAFSKVNI